MGTYKIHTENQSKSDYQEQVHMPKSFFPKYRGVLTLGDSLQTAKRLTHMVGRGIDFSNDDRMLPNSTVWLCSTYPW